MTALRNVADIYPLSPLQEGMLVESLLDAGEDLYFRQFAVRLEGELDAALFERAWRRALERHDVLRTAFLWDGLERPLQVVRQRVELPFAVEDWCRFSGAEQRRRLAAFLAEDRRRGFDLARAPLMRLALLRLGGTAHRLVWTHHHLILDGWSRGLLLQEVLASYDALCGGSEPEAPPPPPFRDYVAWLERRDAAASEGFWRRQLAGFTAPTPIAAERRNGRPAAARSAMGLRRAALPPAAAVAVARLAQRLQISLGTVVHGAWALLLARHGGEDDVVFGSVFHGRSAELPEMDRRIGMLINTLPVRVPVPAAAAVGAWLRELHERFNELRRHEHDALPDIRRWSEVPVGEPLFESLVVYQPPALLEQGPARLRVSELHLELETSNHAFSLMALPRNGLELRLLFDRRRCGDSAAERLLRHLATLLAGLAAGRERRLGEVEALTPGERHQALREWNDPVAEPLWRGPAHRRFERLAAAQPAAIAVRARGRTLAYAELDRRAEELAERLRRLGVGPEAVVAVCLERTPELPVALLAVLKAGAAFLPIDAAFPVARVRFMLEDAGVAVVLTAVRLLPLLPDGAPVLLLDDPGEAAGERAAPRPDAAVAPESLAYVIYTSGSTGRPKGVMVSHRGLASYLDWALAAYPEAARGGSPVHTSVAFDLTLTSLLLPLVAGHAVELVEEGPGVEALAAALAGGVPPGFLKLTPSHARLLAEAPAAAGLAARSGALILGGEGLNGEDVALWRDAAPTTPVYNEYGPTEAVVGCCLYAARAGELATGAVPIGRAATPHGRVHLLDRELRPVPLGSTGELYLGGPALARGYLGRPEMTAERFLPDPFGAAAGGRLYRTGDLARHRPDGHLDYLGRADGQIKLRGHRIEPGEIEAALARHPEVGRAAVALRGVGAEARLVAYVAPRERGTALDAAALDAFLRRELPAPMVPPAIVQLDPLPLGPHGKVDRRALPDPEPADLRRGRAAPRTPVEEMLVGVWGQLLGVEGAGPDDDFFALGGHSLLATRLTSRLRHLFAVDLSLREVFAAPRLGELAARIEELRGAGPARRARQEPIVPLPRDPEGLPLSFGQQRLWFLDQLYPGSPLYNVPGTLRLRGPLAAAALAGALTEVIRRHEVLRTVFRSAGGEARQVVLPPAPVTLLNVDLGGLGPAARRSEADRLTREEARRPFDLARGPVLRGKLLRLGPEEHVLLLAMHHIVSDGWSMGLLVDELEAAYSALRAGGGPPLAHVLPPLPVQYADFAVWQRRRSAGWGEQLAYWRRQLGGVPPVLELPADRPRAAAPDLRGARESYRLPPALAEAAGRLARREGATLFMVALAALECLLGRHAGQHDFCVGSPTAGRTRLETEPLIGFFLNTLAFRARLDGDPTGRELLARVREAALDAHAHQEVPFEHLVEELQPERDLSHAPLFQVLFTFQNAWPQSLRLPDLAIERLDAWSGTAKFDLNWVLVPQPLAAGPATDATGMTGYVEYPVERFGAATIRRLVGHFQVLLDGLAAEPERRVAELPLLSPAERHQLLCEHNATEVRLAAPAGLHALFAAWAARVPGRTAVACGDAALTYAVLEAQANRLAHRLRRLGAGPETPVAIALERSVETVVAILAALKAGAAYVPLEVRQPAARLRWILDDCGAVAVVTCAAWRELAGGRPAVCLDGDAEAIAAEPAAPPGGGAAAEGLAYVVYTSRSTRRPKGVAVEHRQILNYVQGLVERLRLAPGLAYATVSTFAADLGMTCVFAALCHGGTLHVVPEELALDGDALAAYFARHAIDVLKIVPSHLQALTGAAGPPPAALLPRRLLVLGGEAARPEWVAALARAGDCAVVNHYGPTETTVGVLTHPASRPASSAGGASVPLGRPLPNSRAYVLDGGLRPVPVWVAGELCVGGAGVARGYHGQPALTAERFVPDPHAATAGARLYRTGDLARLLPDGAVEFLGRRDHQVKFHGHRLELEGVRQLLREHPLVRDGVARLLRDEEGRDVLVAYYVARHPLAAEELRAHLGRHLPEETLPTLFVHLRRLPLGLNGKVAYDALPPLAEIRGRLAAAPAAPESPTAELLAGIWSQVLGIERVGPDDSFFAVGGHSLVATQVVARVRESCSVELPLRALFERPTVRGLAAHLDRLRRDGAGLQAPPPITPVDRSGDLPPSFTQVRIWLQEQLRPGGSFYNVTGAIRLRGELVATAWQRALSEIVRRHEVLRTAFRRRGDGVVLAVLPAAPLPLPLVDLASLSAACREGEMERLAREEARRPFDLAAGPLVRSRLVAAGAREHLLLLALHHIAGDGLSIAILARELGELSAAFGAGRPSPLPELPVQYADFASWQRQWLRGEVLARQVAFWRRRLAGAPGALALPTDRPRPAAQTAWGDRQRLRLPPPLVAGARALARESAATLFMTLLAAFKVVLRHLSGQDDLVVGTNVAGREHAATEALIGCFINQLVLRTVLAGEDSFRRLVAKVRETALAAYAHQELPFEKLVEELNPRRDPSRALLFQVKMELLHRQPIDRHFRHLEASRFEVDHPVVRYDLHLALRDDGSEVGGLLHYDDDLFTPATVARVAGHFEGVLAAAVEDPERTVDELCALLAARECGERSRREAELEAFGLHRLRQVRRRVAAPAAEGAP